MKGRGCPALRYASDGDSYTSEPSALSYLNRIAQTVRPYKRVNFRMWLMVLQ